jgi:hypothetical protein
LHDSDNRRKLWVGTLPDVPFNKIAVLVRLFVTGSGINRRAFPKSAADINNSKGINQDNIPGKIE